MISQSEKIGLENLSNVSLYCAGTHSARVKYSFKMAQRLLQTSSL